MAEGGKSTTDYKSVASAVAGELAGSPSALSACARSNRHPRPHFSQRMRGTRKAMAVEILYQQVIHRPKSNTLLPPPRHITPWVSRFCTTAIILLHAGAEPKKLLRFVSLRDCDAGPTWRGWSSPAYTPRCAKFTSAVREHRESHKQ